MNYQKDTTTNNNHVRSGNSNSTSNSNSKYEAYQFELKATFALNNLAISMMENFCYDQAFETSKAALMSLQAVTDGDSSQKTVIRNSIKQAFHRGTHPQPSPVSLNVAIVTLDTDATTTCTTTTNNNNSSQQHPQHNILRHCGGYTLLKLTDSCQTSLATQFEDLTFLTAIVLFNFAVCSLCKTRCCCSSSFDDYDDDDDDATTTDHEAIVILHLAHDLLKDAATAYNKQSQNNDEITTSSSTTTTTPSHISSSLCSSSSSCSSSNSSSDNHNHSSFSLYSLIISTTVVVLQTLSFAFFEAGHKDDSLACKYELTHV